MSHALIHDLTSNLQHDILVFQKHLLLSSRAANLVHRMESEHPSSCTEANAKCWSSKDQRAIQGHVWQLCCTMKQDKQKFRLTPVAEAH